GGGGSAIARLAVERDLHAPIVAAGAGSRRQRWLRASVLLLILARRWWGLARRFGALLRLRGGAGRLVARLRLLVSRLRLFVARLWLVGRPGVLARRLVCRLWRVVRPFGTRRCGFAHRFGALRLVRLFARPHVGRRGSALDRCGGLCGLWRTLEVRWLRQRVGRALVAIVRLPACLFRAGDVARARLWRLARFGRRRAADRFDRGQAALVAARMGEARRGQGAGLRRSRFRTAHVRQVGGGIRGAHRARWRRDGAGRLGLRRGGRARRATAVQHAYVRERRGRALRRAPVCRGEV